MSALTWRPSVRPGRRSLPNPPNWPLDIYRSFNPYSEAGFKTFKYRPDFPDRFDSLQAAISHAERFFDWYNFEHHHWGLRLLTPAQVHHGHTATVVAHRQSVLNDAFAAHPERFRNRRPIVKPPASKVWINKPEQEQEDSTQ